MREALFAISREINRADERADEEENEGRPKQPWTP
jgi:hypothetical protein